MGVAFHHLTMPADLFSREESVSLNTTDQMNIYGTLNPKSTRIGIKRNFKSKEYKNRGKKEQALSMILDNTNFDQSLTFDCIKKRLHSL